MRAMSVGIALAMTLLVGSCAPLSTTSKPAPEDRLTPGVTTVDRAIVLLGQPTRVSAEPGGSQTLYWQRARATRGRSAGPTAIVFDAHDVMVRFTGYHGP